VTVSLENVTPADALEAIVNANGLAYTKKPSANIFMVYPLRAERSVLEPRCSI